ncbi:LysR family transcriptional regulator [Streptacidiphilus fuscans]|uniref:LysR family transcriptional regulator n=1 Tax=Streptacidiphilus fuscans TaxID=2789292 RepID=A0A931F9E2_9ACTN|nr:LysR family transcriptional regulator [Streptacidiphilus fuscans]MBF9066512.1 LysR family transcriptional regulator [Streptacidiphilus fuscans]
MELRQLAYAVAVADTGSFTRAAQRCFVVQSALSHQIARLEEELGTRLFERNSRRVQVTAAGEVFLGPAREALAAAERARSEVVAHGGEVRGTLHIGTITPLAALDLPDLLATYQERHPAVRVTLRTRIVSDLLQQVRDHTCDLAFVDADPQDPPRGLVARVLAHEDMVAIVPHGHRLAGAAEATLAGLAEEGMVDMPPGSGIRQHNDEAFAAAGVTRTVAFEADAMVLLEQLVARGLGPALVSAAAADRMPTVRSVPLTGVPPRVIQALWNASGASPAARAFVELLRERTPDAPPAAQG